MRNYTFDEEVFLIAVTERTNGVGDVTVQEVKRRSYAETVSVYERETYEAMAVGHKPEFKVILPSWTDDYNGERLLEYAGTRYSVLRAYKADDLTAELTVTKS